MQGPVVFHLEVKGSVPAHNRHFLSLLFLFFQFLTLMTLMIFMFCFIVLQKTASPLCQNLHFILKRLSSFILGRLMSETSLLLCFF